MQKQMQKGATNALSCARFGWWAMKDRILCIPNWERIKESERGIDSEATLGDYVARVYGSE